MTLAQRLMKAPLGAVIGESVGKLKSVLVDRVETIELPLAHMIPECISNLLLPVAVFVYLVCIDGYAGDCASRFYRLCHDDEEF